MKNLFKDNQTLFTAITVSFLIWIAVFWQYISGTLALTSDSVSYYNHIKFYIVNLANGSYPLWDPNWHYGSPNEFFLRRMGSFNPFLLIILFFFKLGISYATSYMIFLVSYYFLGCIGFFILAQHVFKDKFISFTAFVLLLFSAIGTRIFDSFIVLEFVPIIWFFAFLVLFFNGKQRLGFLGMIFTTMILLTTYIPFYFLNIAILFLLCYFIFYPKMGLKNIKQIFTFINVNKLFAAVCILVLIFSLIPGIRLYMDASKGEFALGKRHAKAQSENVIEVGKDTITNWGIEEDVYFTYTFKDLSKMKLAAFYMPIFFYILCVLGVFTKCNKLLAFLFSFFFSIAVVFSPYAPIYNILHEKIFYFKLFRNLHFYLWWAILPAMILFACELFRIILTSLTEKNKHIIFSMICFILHVFIYYMTQKYHYGAFSTNIVIILSCLFFIIYPWLKKNERLLYFVITVIVCLQPIEVYTYFAHNTRPNEGGYVYDTPFLDFEYTRDRLKKRANQPKKSSKAAQPLHYSSANYANLLQKVDSNLIKDYLYFKFVLYDTKPKDHILNFKNFKGIEEKSQTFEVLDYSPNKIKVRTNFSENQYLVYNDNYHSSWHATINGKQQKIDLSNFSFKGISIPSGEQIVELRFGKAYDYLLNALLMCSFYFVFIFIIAEAVKLKGKDI